MTPPASPGQRNVLKTHYERIRAGPVAYLDETYHLENDGRRRFYVIAAVVVLEPDRDFPTGSPSRAGWGPARGVCSRAPSANSPVIVVTRVRSHPS